VDTSKVKCDAISKCKTKDITGSHIVESALLKSNTKEKSLYIVFQEMKAYFRGVSYGSSIPSIGIKS